MPIPGPLGGAPAPGNPPTPASPQPTSANALAPQAQVGAANEQDWLNSILGLQLGGISTSASEQNLGLTQQQGIGQAQKGITDQQLQQQLSDTLAGLGLSGQSLGVQRAQIGQESALEQGQYGVQQQQNVLSGQGLQAALKNLQQQYGFQQTGMTEGAAGSGLSTSHALTQEQQQAAEAYQYNLFQNQQAQKQLGLTEKGEALSNTYQQQQIQDALKNLGISGGQLALQGTEAQQGYQSGTQQAANTYLNLVNQLGLAQGANLSGEQSQGEQIYDALLGAGMFTG